MQTQTLTSRDVPRLLRELLDQVQSETRRPISPTINRLSEVIEVASATIPEVTLGDDWQQWGLTPTESKLATILKSRGGNAVHREVILSALYGDELYGDDGPQDKILDVFICKLNKKLAGFYILENEYGLGYRMISLKKGRDPRDVIEWRGIFMGVKSALAAERMYGSMNRWTHTRDIAKACNSQNNSVGAIVRSLKKNLLGTPYRIENHRQAGYRMVRIHAA